MHERTHLGTMLTLTIALFGLVGGEPLAGQSTNSRALEVDMSWNMPDNSYPTRAYRIQSNILNEERRIFVALPPSHEQTTRQYPLIVVFDGEAILNTVMTAASALARAGHAPEAVIVGVENTDRLRDLSPPGLPVSGNGGSGQADQFLDFLEMEMRPALAESVRAGGPVFLVGHSSGGLFVHYAAATRPEVFGSVLSLDAPMHLEEADATLTDLAAESSSTVRIVSLEARFGWPDDAWNSLVRTAPGGWTLFREEMVSETHQTMVWPGSYTGLKYLFADFSTVGAAAISPLDILRGFDERSPGGGQIPPPQILLRQAVEDLIIARDLEAASSTLERMILAYGESRLADGLRAQIADANPDELEGPPVAELLTAPRPPAEAVETLVGSWVGYSETEGSGVRQAVKLTVRIENGVPVGELAAGQAPARSLEYIGIDGDEFHLGYMNGMRPRGLLMYEGTIKDDVFEGLFLIRGVVFTLPNGREIPITHFRLERVAGEDA